MLDTADSRAVPASTHGLFVVPDRRRDGFDATIRGHLLELADPDSGHALAPTPDDLFISSIASDFAWSAQRFLRARRLPDDVSVSAEWRTPENRSRLTDVSMTVTVSETVEPTSDALEQTLAERVAARSLHEPPRLHVRCVG